MEAVLTTCPPSPCALILGTNVTTPLTTPPRLTPSTQSQSWYVASAMSLKRLIAGVVAEDVDVSEDALGLVCRAGECLAVGHVELDRMHVATELSRRRLEVVGPYVGDRDAHACRDESLRHAEPDATAASGDEGDSALDVPHALRTL